MQSSCREEFKLSLEEAEKIYCTNRKGSEGHISECYECKKVLELAKNKRSNSVVVDRKTNHLIGIVSN